MLEGLERVDWLSLTHAYGPAGDVPGFIRSLAAADREVRTGARHALYGNVFHQGTRYEASSYALPFLIELACERSVPDRDELLRLIAHLAVGYQEGYVLRGGFDRASAKAEQDALEQDEGNEWKFDAVNVYDAAVAHSSALVELAEYDPDVNVRVAATYTLAFLPDAAAETLPLLRRLLDSVTDVRELANAVLAYAMLASRSHDDSLTRRLVALSVDHHVLIRYAAATARARHQLATGVLDPDAMHLLMRSLLDDADALRSPALSWNEGDLIGLGWITMEVSAPVFDPETVRQAAETLRRLDGARAVTLSGVLLAKLFPTSAGPPPERADELSGEQRIFLNVLASTPSVWTIGGRTFGNFSLQITAFGLPGDANATKRYLNGEALNECRPPGLRRQ